VAPGAAASRALAVAAAAPSPVAATAPPVAGRAVAPAVPGPVDTANPPVAARPADAVAALPAPRRLALAPEPAADAPLADPVAPLRPSIALPPPPPAPSPAALPVRGSTPPAAPASSAAAAPAAAPRPVQRAVVIDELQTAVDDPAAPAAPAGPAPAAPAPAAPAGGGAVPGGLQDPEQLREHVLRWVRAELLINRERAGRLSDIH
jgi:hypothetical protein